MPLSTHCQLAGEDSDAAALIQAQKHNDWPKWKAAMDFKMVMLEQAGTWCDVLCPQGKNIVGSKWVFKIKRKANGSIEKYKVCLIAQGFTQVYGEDYFNTYFPIARLCSFHLILALAAHHNWDIESFNFVGAYLNGKLNSNKEIYMQPPPGYSSNTCKVKQLQKSLYGLKQAGCKWYDTLVCALSSLGFHTTSTNPGVFYAHMDKQVLILAVHVDDCVLTGSSKDLIATYKQKLNACYTLTNLGPLHWLLGIKITCNQAAHTISLS